MKVAIAAIENNITSNNGVMLIREILDLLSGVGDGFRTGDYYAPDRFYSAISGVKNIRIFNTDVFVKVTTPSGYLLPKKITIHDTEYRINCIKSSNFNSEVDY